MSMSVRCEGCGLEYAGARRLRRAVRRSRRNLARPRYLRMLGEVTALPPARAPGARRRAAPATSPLGAFLAAGGYSRYFVDHFMMPLVSRGLVGRAETVSLSYPARYLFTFLDHHGMLAVGGSPPWRTVVGGSRSYVERVGEGAVRGRASAPRCARSAAPADGRRDPRRRRRRAPRSTASCRHPPGPGAGACSPHPTDAERDGARRLPLLPQRDLAAHRRFGAAPPAPAPGRRGTT